MNPIKNTAVLLFLLISLNGKAQSKDSLAVVNTTQKFLKAFKDFDWETFKGCFSKDATMFFPYEYRERKTGKAAIEATWAALFPEFTDKTKTLDLKLNPQNVLTQVFGNTAIVTFHFGEGTDYLSRRTLVFIKENEQWKIVHLHASGLKKE